ncbi:MAG: hypothetical protein VW865_14135, partial [Halieaceae bacterium]
AYNLANGRITFTEAPKSSLISKSRDVFLSGVYPSTAAFSDDEQLAVVRVYEIILDDTNIRSQYLEITNADEDAFAVGSPLTQGQITGIVTEATAKVDGSNFVHQLTVVTGENNDDAFATGAATDPDGRSHTIS